MYGLIMLGKADSAHLKSAFSLNNKKIRNITCNKQ